MAIKDIFKVSRKTFVNPSGWLGYQGLKANTSSIWGIVRDLFYPPQETSSETFDEAMARMGVTETDLKEQSERYFIYATVFMTLAVITVLYSVYLLLSEHTFHGFLIGLAVSALFGSQAFRFHFWHFQIERRKLGCTFQEWKQSWFNPKQGSTE